MKSRFFSSIIFLDPKKFCFSWIFKGKRECAFCVDLFARIVIGENVGFSVCKGERKGDAFFLAILAAEGEKYACFAFGIKEAVGGEGVALLFSVPRSQKVEFLQKIGIDLFPFVQTEAQNTEILIGI